MSLFEFKKFNRWAGAVLSAGLLLIVLNIFGDVLFPAHHDGTSPVYLVETPDETKSAESTGRQSVIADDDAALNQLMTEKGCAGCDLSGADLADRNLIAHDFRGADLS